MWLITPNWTQPDFTSVRALPLAYLKGGFGLIRGMWLTFAYMGAVLLLASRRPTWVRRLTAFRSTGRMALTVYMIQIAILDLAFSNYALHISLTPLQALAGGLMLFASMRHSADGGSRDSGLGHSNGSGDRSHTHDNSRGAPNRRRSL